MIQHKSRWEEFEDIKGVVRDSSAVRRLFKGAIKNGQFRETSNIGYTGHRRMTSKTHLIHYIYFYTLVQHQVNFTTSYLWDMSDIISKRNTDWKILKSNISSFLWRYSAYHYLFYVFLLLDTFQLNMLWISIII
jgi:hypothetical protein